MFVIKTRYTVYNSFPYMYVLWVIYDLLVLSRLVLSNVVMYTMHGYVHMYTYSCIYTQE